MLKHSASISSKFIFLTLGVTPRINDQAQRDS